MHSFDATGAPDGAVEFIIDAYENDAMFYEFESCVMVDYFDLIGGTVTKEAAACVVDRQSAVTTEAEYKHFRYSEVNPSATTSQAAGADGGSTCGGYKDVSYDTISLKSDPNYTAKFMERLLGSDFNET